MQQIFFFRLLLFYLWIHVLHAFTNPQDAAVLRSLKDQWDNTPPSWDGSDDACAAWEGIACNNSRVTSLGLSTMGLSGKMSGDIGGLTELISLDLSFNPGLTGPLSPRLGDLQKLTILALNSNNLTGGIPDSLGKLSKLYWLDLADNQLSGQIPVSSAFGPGLDQLKKAKHFHFNKNKLSGEIPSQLFNSDMSLIHVNLAHNMLSGLLPNLTGMNSLNYVDLSNNTFKQSKAPDWFSTLQSLTTLVIEYGPLEGSVPSEIFSLPQIQEVLIGNTGMLGYSRKHGLLSNSTIGKALFYEPGKLCDDYLQVQLELFSSDAKYFNRSMVQRIGFSLINQTYKPPHEFGPYYFIATPLCFWSKGMIAGITSGCAFLAVVLAVLAAYAIRQKRRAEQAISLSKPFASWAPSGKDSGGAPQLKGARWFSYDDLKKCTNNFSESNQIGSGGYGKVYRGVLSTGQVVAIKRAQQGSTQGGLEFKTEIELLSRVHHKNLLGLIGFCFEQEEQMLVYEFMANGTLRESLSGKSGVYLDWKRRLRIALGSARGLAYLHELANPPIIHRDVKSSNILLDDNLTAKVADFGLSKLVSDSSKGHVSTQVKGTLGYLDPEYYMTQQLTEKSDVYSFGVVMLELITAKQPIEKGKYVVREVRIAMDKNDDDTHYGLADMMDPTIRNTPCLVGFQKFLELAVQCVEESASDRPTMAEVVKFLETMLQNDGLNTNSTSASSSATEFIGAGKGGLKHPYSDAFDYSGGYTLQAKVEPK
ncbi:probable leucine-rich repeat receptor-like protein kinase at5g49770 [Phtheirospermum japonicum]|uniref:non-specific serine/threonine protein kinase n=1 Tax=Phtheirospermum japonicum TaxID=374723 RepID=A0A830BV82_9LAMI|nr:probable leucine-rich repeat receptor-like protein kinase at5g49770 [Phtheirospermum japonicum]